MTTGGGMSAEITIRIALGVLLVLVVGLVVVGVVGTRDVEEEKSKSKSAQSGLLKEVQEVCEKARHDLRTGTAEGELDEVQRAALEDVIATECE
jgi:hypothetical protein